MAEEKRNTEKLTLEELLRMKKSEQPDEMFWRRFDRELEKKIVRSVVSREPRFYFLVRWFQSHAVVSVGAACLVLLVALIFAGGNQETGETVNSVVKSPPATLAVVSAQEKARPAERMVNAPALNGSDSNFMIEVLSSGGAVSSSANLTFSGNGQVDGGGSYYVADQLSSADQGWSGERLPF